MSKSFVLVYKKLCTCFIVVHCLIPYQLTPFRNQLLWTWMKQEHPEEDLMKPSYVNSTNREIHQTVRYCYQGSSMRNHWMSIFCTRFIQRRSFLSAFWCARLCTESVNATAFILSMIPLQLCSWNEVNCIFVFWNWLNVFHTAGTWWLLFWPWPNLENTYFKNFSMTYKY